MEYSIYNNKKKKVKDKPNTSWTKVRNNKNKMVIPYGEPI